MCDNETGSYNCRLYSYPTNQHVTYYSNTINTGKKNENFIKSHYNKERELTQCLKSILN